MFISFHPLSALNFINYFLWFTLHLIHCYSTFPRSTDYWFYIIFLFFSCFFSNICTQCYKFPSKPCFRCTPQIMARSIFHFHLVQNILKFQVLLKFFLWSVCYLEVCYLISKCLGNFLVIFLKLNFSLIPLWFESIHSIILILLNLLRCILWPRTWSILVDIPCELKKNSPVVALKWSVIVSYIHLVDGVLITVLPARSVHFWWRVLKFHGKQMGKQWK